MPNERASTKFSIEDDALELDYRDLDTLEIVLHMEHFNVILELTRTDLIEGLNQL